jgi:hypothetical protein
MDNTVKTNKNGFMCDYFREIVAYTAYELVQISFNIRGHTKV